MVLLSLLAVLVLLAVGGSVYVRLAPTDPDEWHQPPNVTKSITGVGSARRLEETGPLGLALLHDIALATPRTQVLAGTVESGMVTYITRSALWGFPDFTTVQQDGDQLQIYGRLRFGKSDLGVNAARVDDWLEELRPKL